MDFRHRWKEKNASYDANARAVDQLNRRGAPKRRPRKPGKNEASKKGRNKGEFGDELVTDGNAKKVAQAVRYQILQRLRDKQKLTGAEHKALERWEAEEKVQALPPPPAPVLAVTKEEPPADPLDDLEEWATREGVVRGKYLTLGQLATRHSKNRGELEKMLWKVQRGLLARYGFEGSRKSGPLTGTENQALQLVKSIEQIAQANRQWQMQMEVAEKTRREGRQVSMEEFESLILTVQKIVNQRDKLMIKLKEIDSKGKKIGGRGQSRGTRFEVAVRPLEEP